MMKPTTSNRTRTRASDSPLVVTMRAQFSSDTPKARAAFVSHSLPSNLASTLLLVPMAAPPPTLPLSWPMPPRITTMNASTM